MALRQRRQVARPGENWLVAFTSPQRWQRLLACVDPLAEGSTSECDELRDRALPGGRFRDGPLVVLDAGRKLARLSRPGRIRLKNVETARSSRLGCPRGLTTPTGRFSSPRTIWIGSSQGFRICICLARQRNGALETVLERQPRKRGHARRRPWRKGFSARALISPAAAFPSPAPSGSPTARALSGLDDYDRVLHDRPEQIAARVKRHALRLRRP
jgi:hypothetical protein